jgi:hypothetical protein
MSKISSLGGVMCASALLVLGLSAPAALAQSNNQSNARNNALQQLINTNRSSRAAKADADRGNLEKAKAESNQGFDTSTSTSTAKDNSQSNSKSGGKSGH